MATNYVKIGSYLSIVLMLVSCTKDNGEADLYSGKPKITEIRPLEGDENSVITLTGINFGKTVGDNIILFGEKEVVAKTASSTVVTFAIPQEIIDGDYDVTIKVNSESSQAVVPFRLRLDQSKISHSFPASVKSVNSLFVKNKSNLTRPRLYYHKADIDRIKNMASSVEPMGVKASYDAIIQAADKILMEPLLTYGLDAAGKRIESLHAFGGTQSGHLALASLFTSDAKYADRFYKQMKEMATWSDWGADRHFLDVGIGVSGMAMCFDAMYDHLTVAQREEIYVAVKKFALDPALDQLRKKKEAWVEAENNWNGICNGGVIEAALAFYEFDPLSHAEIIASAVNNIPIYLRSLGPDGASEEGIGYWNYGVANTFMSIESLKCCLDNTYGIGDMLELRKTGWHPYDMSGPVGTISIGDAALFIGKENMMASYFWFAYHFQDAALARTHRDRMMIRNARRSSKLNGWRDLLFYDPELVAEGVANESPLSKEIKGVDYAFIKENNDERGFYAGIHGGDNAASHGHVDAGSFYIQANGEYFIHGSLGNVSPYPKDYFRDSRPAYGDVPSDKITYSGRQCYYRARAEGKSVVVINPDARPEQNIKGVAHIEKSTDTYHILNLSDCYQRDVNQYKRGIKIDRQRRAITIQDEFTLKQSSKVYWLAHSQNLNSAILSLDKRVVTFSSGSKTMKANLISPSDARFTIVQSVSVGVNYLPETKNIFQPLNGIIDQVNTNFGKLQIEFAAITGQQIICVEFTDVGAQQGVMAPIASW